MGRRRFIIDPYSITHGHHSSNGVHSRRPRLNACHRDGGSPRHAMHERQARAHALEEARVALILGRCDLGQHHEVLWRAVGQHRVHVLRTDLAASAGGAERVVSSVGIARDARGASSSALEPRGRRGVRIRGSDRSRSTRTLLLPSNF